MGCKTDITDGRTCPSANMERLVQMKFGASESAVRRLARKSGYLVRKSRAAESADQLGEFQLVEAERNMVVLGGRFDATLHDISAFLTA